jgi:hypothetical protein
MDVPTKLGSLKSGREVLTYLSGKAVSIEQNTFRHAAGGEVLEAGID